MLKTFSVVLATTITVSCALISAQQRDALVNQPNNQQDPQPVPYEQYERDIRAIADELKAIREQEAQDERNRATQKEPGGPPVWSNWILAVIAAIAGGVAYKAFTHQRDAVYATERADVLIDTIYMVQYGDKDEKSVYVPTFDTMLKIIVKNFGRTRATNVRVSGLRLEIASKSVSPPIELPMLVLGSNQTSVIALSPLAEWFDRSLIATLRGPFRHDGNRLRLFMDLEYVDTFGATHKARAVGYYMPLSMNFAIEHQTVN